MKKREYGHSRYVTLYTRVPEDEAAKIRRIAAYRGCSVYELLRCCCAVMREDDVTFFPPIRGMKTARHWKFYAINVPEGWRRDENVERR